MLLGGDTIIRIRKGGPPEEILITRAAVEDSLMEKGTKTRNDSKRKNGKENLGLCLRAWKSTPGFDAEHPI